MERRNMLFQGLVVLASVMCICHSAKLMSGVSVVPGKGIVANYTPRGGEYEIGNLTVYESQNRAAKRLLIAGHDLFALSTNLKQIVDIIAELYDFRVVLPDFFHGHRWDENNFPPENPEDLQKWVQEHGSWNVTVKSDVMTVINAFRSRENITEVGVFGMCFGGMVSTMSAIEIPEIKAAALVHPTYVANDQAEFVQAPMYIITTRDDPDLQPFYEVLQQKFGNNSGYKRFDDMPHGFAGSKGNFSDPLVVQRVEEVIEILGGFFNYNLRNQFL